jgi:hypothetical protein
MDRLTRLLWGASQKMQEKVGQGQLWLGRRIKVFDGTCVNLADTRANQARYPQSRDQKPGCGFPLMRIMGLFCLVSGALLGYVTGHYYQSELALVSGLFEFFQRGDLLVSDRHFGCYRILALGLHHHVDLICRLHASRKIRRPKKKKGQQVLDWTMSWTRPNAVPPGMTGKLWSKLSELLTVRLVSFEISSPGFRSSRITLVTTLLDQGKYPAELIAQLYGRRWRVELCFRELKTTLGMEFLPNQTPDMAERELLMHLLAYQSVRALMQQAALQGQVSLERISFKGSLDAALAFSFALTGAKNQQMRRALFALLLEILATDLVPDRPGRREPRAIKRRLKRFPRLNCHRKDFCDIPHENRVLARRKKARKNRGLN